MKCLVMAADHNGDVAVECSIITKMLNPLAAFLNLGHCTSSLSGVHEYLAVDSGGYLCIVFAQ